MPPAVVAGSAESSRPAWVSGAAPSAAAGAAACAGAAAAASLSAEFGGRLLVRDRLADGVLRSLARSGGRGEDRFGTRTAASAASSSSGRSSTAAAAAPQLIVWIPQAAGALDADARAVLDAFRGAVETRQAWSDLRGAYVLKRRREEYRRKEKKKKSEQMRAARGRSRRTAAPAPPVAARRKVPRRTLLSNISDYDRDLEDDFFSELIEQVRLPTFTLEEYYGDEDGDEAQEEGEEQEEAGGKDFVPAEPIYTRAEFARAVREVRRAWYRSAVSNETAAGLPGAMDGEPPPGGAWVENLELSYAALRPYRRVATGTVRIGVPQCSLEELQASTLDRISRRRYQRALERVWEQHHPSRRPVLHDFCRVPFPHCNLEDLQLLALDVLHQRRADRHQRGAGLRHDPALRVAFCLRLAGVPWCDPADLRARPVDQVLLARRRRTRGRSSISPAADAEGGAHPAPSSLDAEQDAESPTRASALPSSFSTGGARRTSWQESVRQRVQGRRHRYQDGKAEDLEEEDENEALDDWDPSEYEKEWDGSAAGGAEKKTPTVSPAVRDEGASMDESKLWQTDAIVSHALRKERSNLLHLAVKANRPDQEPEEDDVDALGAPSNGGPRPATKSQREGADRRRSYGAGEVRADASIPDASEGSTFQFFVPRTGGRSGPRRGPPEPVPNLKTRPVPVANRDADLDVPVELELDKPPSDSGLVRELAPDLDEDHELCGDSLSEDSLSESSPTDADLGQVLLDLHLDIEGELHLVEARLRDVREEIRRLKSARYGDASRPEEAMNARDISVLREGCDWSARMGDFGAVDGVERLWHAWRDPHEEGDSVDAEERALLREFNAADAFG